MGISALQVHLMMLKDEVLYAAISTAGGEPLLPGESDIDQLGLVGRLYGGLTPQQWPGITAAPDYGEPCLNFASVESIQDGTTS
jgi:hypothetical protein